MALGSIELRSPSEGGEDAWLVGTDTPVSYVLHLLAVDGSVEAVVSSPLPPPKDVVLSSDLVLECVAYALEQVRDHAPAPAVMAALEHSWRAESSFSIADARHLAEEILPQVLAGGTPKSKGSNDVAIAFSYASAVVRNGRFPRLPNEESTLRDGLDPHDRSLLEDFYVFRQEIAGFRITPELHVERWERLVGSVASIYHDAFEEFVNELDGRDILEDAVSVLSPPGRKTMRSAIDPIDERYDRLTQWSDEPLSPVPYPRRRWWWFRVPTNADQ